MAFIKSKSPIKILAVDDKPENLLSLKRYLTDPDIEIVCAGSGNEALGLILEERFALILLDVQMPDMDGFETAELIRENNDSREIPIIFVTAISKEEQHVFKGYQSGAVDYLFKPFNPEILKSKVDVFVKLHRQTIELEYMNTHLETLVEERTQELQKEKTKAEQANVSKSRFLSNMSHEIMTPLHHVIHYSHSGKRATSEDEDHKLNKQFSRILESGKRLQYLTQNLIDLSQLQAGSVKFFFSETNLDCLVSNVLITLTPVITGKPVVVNQEKPSFSPTVLGDAEKLSVLFAHVIRNAIQYSEPGETIRIVYSKVEANVSSIKTSYTKVSIIDEGVGIPENELEMVFDAFSESSSTARNSGGKGLGLAICLEIVKAHNGKIWAENREKGTAFHILLPDAG